MSCVSCAVVADFRAIAGITLGFEIKIEVLTESIIGSITTEEWSQRMREKLQRRLQKQKARQGSCGLLEKVAPCVAKRIEDRKERRLQRIGSENELLTDEEMRARGMCVVCVVRVVCVCVASSVCVLRLSSPMTLMKQRKRGTTSRSRR